MSALLLLILQFFGIPVDAHGNLALAPTATPASAHASSGYGAVRRGEGPESHLPPVSLSQDTCDISNGF